MYPGNVIRYYWAIVFIWLLFQDLLQIKCKFQKNLLVMMPFLHLFLFPPAITFLKFQQWSCNFLTRYMSWSKFDKIHPANSALPKTEVCEKTVFPMFRNQPVAISHNTRSTANIWTQNSVLLEMWSPSLCLRSEKKTLQGYKPF